MYFPFRISKSVHFYFIHICYILTNIFCLIILIASINFTAMSRDVNLINCLRLFECPGKEIYVMHGGYKFKQEKQYKSSLFYGKTIHYSNGPMS